jgi:predicted metalloprotease with PDZ domain
MKFLVLIVMLLPIWSIFSQKVNYHLRMIQPQNHYYQVEMDVEDLKKTSFDVKLPVWAPGSYLIREFSKNINLVKAFDSKGKEIRVEKKKKNVWTIHSNNASFVKIKYEVYAFELSVRTSFLDLTHGFVSGSGVFMYVEELMNKKGSLTIYPHSSFKKVTTALESTNISKASDSEKSFEFQHYDQLVDCPIEIGNQEEFTFESAGIKHTVAMYGEGNYSVEKLKVDMAKVVQKCTDVFGFNPNKEYVFIIHNVSDGQGGLEHTNSTVLSVSRWQYGNDYYGFLNLVAHEYFHLWNVKRIRPIELGPFNYGEENYTSLLWVMEGFTSYYDELIMRRAGFYSKETMLSKIQGLANYVEGSVGARVQPVAHASFDAWIKAYRPNENSANTTMTYYSRGALLASVFDAMIIEHSKGKQCLDHALQYLYMVYFVQEKRGFTENELKLTLEQFTGRDLTSFFEKYINGTEIIPYASIFEKVGVTVKDATTETFSFGAAFTTNGGNVTVKSIRANSAAEVSGLSVGDEILGCNGYRADQYFLEDIISEMGATGKAELLVSRDQKLFSVSINNSLFVKPQFQFSANSTSSNASLYNYWLR